MNRLFLLIAVLCAVALAVTDIWNVAHPHQPAWLGASLAFGFTSMLLEEP